MRLWMPVGLFQYKRRRAREAGLDEPLMQRGLQISNRESLQSGLIEKIGDIGDVYTWDYQRYHLASNSGIKPRYTIAITGFTKNILKFN